VREHLVERRASPVVGHRASTLARDERPDEAADAGREDVAQRVPHPLVDRVRIEHAALELLVVALQARPVVHLEPYGEVVDNLVDPAPAHAAEGEEPGLALETGPHHGDVVLGRLGLRNGAEERIDEARQLVGVVARAGEVRGEVGPLAAHVRGGELVEELIDVSHRRPSARGGACARGRGAGRCCSESCRAARPPARD
jgi:hypothetical protein